MGSELTKVRLDKWLWAARFYKTRSLAKQAIDGGKVHVNGHKTKPSKEIDCQCQLKITQGYITKEIEIIALSDKRRGAPEAALLYNETPNSIARREKEQAERKLANAHLTTPDARPNKKQRRQIHRFKNIMHDND